MDCRSSNSIFTLENSGIRAFFAQTRKPACSSSTFSATVFMATDLPPMLAPVMTVAPGSSRMDTGTKDRPFCSSRSHSSGLTMSVSSRSRSVSSGRTPPYRTANSAFWMMKSSRPAVSASASRSSTMGASAAPMALRTCISSDSSSAHSRVRLSRSSSFSASVWAWNRPSSTSFLARRTSLSLAVALSGM